MGIKIRILNEHLKKLPCRYWKDKPMSKQQLVDFFQDAQVSGHKAVMISAKSSIDLSIEQFQNYLSSGLAFEKDSETIVNYWGLEGA